MFIIFLKTDCKEANIKS